MKKSIRKQVFIISVAVLVLVVLGNLYYLATQSNSNLKTSAAGAATLALSPSSSTYTVGNTFDVNIVLNTAGVATVATDAILTYNTTELEVQDADAAKTGIQITAGTLYPVTQDNTVDATAGKISFSQAYTIGTPATMYNGTGTLATIKFKALKAATSRVNFTFTANATNDSNVADASANDILGSVTNGSYVLTDNIAVTANLSLQGRTNYSSTGTVFKVYPAGQTTASYTKPDVTTDATGKATFNMTGLTSGNYDYKIKPSYYLTKAITAQALANPLTLNFGSLSAGDFNNDDVINSLDFATLSAKWGKTDVISDINQDGVVNSIDFAYLSMNWAARGQ